MVHHDQRDARAILRFIECSETLLIIIFICYKVAFSQTMRIWCSMKKKKIPYYLLIFLLTIGAVITLGFLSFGGVYALWPLLPLAGVAFGLSVIYEGEIYFQNIINALHKLFTRNYLPRRVANTFLAECVAKALPQENCPQFFRDYAAQLRLLAAFGHHPLDKASLQKRIRVEKELADMEKWFARQLVAPPLSAAPADEEDDHQKSMRQALQEWLAAHGQDEVLERLARYRRYFQYTFWFSLASAGFMALGTVYLLAEQVAVFPLLASLPLGVAPGIILPMAVIAGIAWGLLTYNAITDMIQNDTLRAWYHKIRNYLDNPETRKRGIALAVFAVVLSVLAIALTVCTAGTWWSIAKTTAPLFAWMRRVPSFLMGVCLPTFTGIAAVFWNMDNTLETLGMIEDMMKKEPNYIAYLWKKLVKAFNTFLERESTWTQRLNPARILLKLTYTPLRILMFLGHLASIAVTADRVPGVPAIASALLGFISEFFEDFHYFAGHDHHHGHELGDLLEERLGADAGHSHDNDLPTKFLRLLFRPLFWLAAKWDCWSSQANADERHRLTWERAWAKHSGEKSERHINLTDEQLQVTSPGWKVEQAVFRIDEFKEKHLNNAVSGRGVARAKARELTLFQDSLRQQPALAPDFADAEQGKAVYATARFFREPQTRTQAFLATLPERVGVAVAAAG